MNLHVFRVNRLHKIMADMVRGVSAERIAEKWGITRARVYQILHHAGWSARASGHMVEQFPTLAEVEAAKAEPAEQN